MIRNMKLIMATGILFGVSLLFLLVILLMQKQEKAPTESGTFTQGQASISAAASGRPVQQDEQQIRYFFDTEGHSVEEIHALLKRAEELQLSARNNQQTMKIAMVMHGPDLDIFTTKNYSMYKEIVDTAARLDAANIIDFKACKVAMESRGLTDLDLPAFFELVPFGPAEIQQLEDGGYVRL